MASETPSTSEAGTSSNSEKCEEPNPEPGTQRLQLPTDPKFHAMNVFTYVTQSHVLSQLEQTRGTEQHSVESDTIPSEVTTEPMEPVQKVADFEIKDEDSSRNVIEFVHKRLNGDSPATKSQKRAQQRMRRVLPNDGKVNDKLFLENLMRKGFIRESEKPTVQQQDAPRVTIPTLPGIPDICNINVPPPHYMPRAPNRNLNLRQRVESSSTDAFAANITTVSTEPAAQTVSSSNASSLPLTLEGTSNPDLATGSQLLFSGDVAIQLNDNNDEQVSESVDPSGATPKNAPPYPGIAHRIRSNKPIRRAGVPNPPYKLPIKTPASIAETVEHVRRQADYQLEARRRAEERSNLLKGEKRANVEALEAKHAEARQKALANQQEAQHKVRAIALANQELYGKRKSGLVSRYTVQSPVGEKGAASKYRVVNPSESVPRGEDTNAKNNSNHEDLSHVADTSDLASHGNTLVSSPSGTANTSGDSFFKIPKSSTTTSVEKSETSPQKPVESSRSNRYRKRNRTTSTSVAAEDPEDRRKRNLAEAEALAVQSLEMLADAHYNKSETTIAELLKNESEGWKNLKKEERKAEQENKVKRKRGAPRKPPKVLPNGEKRKRGRPRKVYIEPAPENVDNELFSLTSGQLVPASVPAAAKQTAFKRDEVETSKRKKTDEPQPKKARLEPAPRKTVGRSASTEMMETQILERVLTKLPEQPAQEPSVMETPQIVPQIIEPAQEPPIIEELVQRTDVSSQEQCMVHEVREPSKMEVPVQQVVVPGQAQLAVQQAREPSILEVPVQRAVAPSQKQFMVQQARIPERQGVERGPIEFSRAQMEALRNSSFRPVKANISKFDTESEREMKIMLAESINLNVMKQANFLIEKAEKEAAKLREAGSHSQATNAPSASTAPINNQITEDTIGQRAERKHSNSPIEVEDTSSSTPTVTTVTKPVVDQRIPAVQEEVLMKRQSESQIEIREDLSAVNAVARRKLMLLNKALGLTGKVPTTATTPNNVTASQSPIHEKEELSTGSEALTLQDEPIPTNRQLAPVVQVQDDISTQAVAITIPQLNEASSLRKPTVPANCDKTTAISQTTPPLNVVATKLFLDRRNDVSTVRAILAGQAEKIPARQLIEVGKDLSQSIVTVRDVLKREMSQKIPEPPKTLYTRSTMIQRRDVPTTNQVLLSAQTRQTPMPIQAHPIRSTETLRDIARRTTPQINEITANRRLRAPVIMNRTAPPTQMLNPSFSSTQMVSATKTSNGPKNVIRAVANPPWFNRRKETTSRCMTFSQHQKLLPAMRSKVSQNENTSQNEKLNVPTIISPIENETIETQSTSASTSTSHFRDSAPQRIPPKYYYPNEIKKMKDSPPTYTAADMDVVIDSVSKGVDSYSLKADAPEVDSEKNEKVAKFAIPGITTPAFVVPKPGNEETIISDKYQYEEDNSIERSRTAHSLQSSSTEEHISVGNNSSKPPIDDYVAEKMKPVNERKAAILQKAIDERAATSNAQPSAKRAKTILASKESGVVEFAETEVAPSKPVPTSDKQNIARVEPRTLRKMLPTLPTRATLKEYVPTMTPGSKPKVVIPAVPEEQISMARKNMSRPLPVSKPVGTRSISASNKRKKDNSVVEVGGIMQETVKKNVKKPLSADKPTISDSSKSTRSRKNTANSVEMPRNIRYPLRSKTVSITCSKPSATNTKAMNDLTSREVTVVEEKVVKNSISAAPHQNAVEAHVVASSNDLPEATNAKDAVSTPANQIPVVEKSVPLHEAIEKCVEEANVSQQTSLDSNEEAYKRAEPMNFNQQSSSESSTSPASTSGGTAEDEQKQMSSLKQHRESEQEHEKRNPRRPYSAQNMKLKPVIAKPPEVAKPKRTRGRK